MKYYIKGGNKCMFTGGVTAGSPLLSQVQPEG